MTKQILLFLVLTAITTINAQDDWTLTDYQLWPNITLPTKTKEGIAAVYGDWLYLIGGRKNWKTFGGVLSQILRMDISSWKTAALNEDKTDFVELPTGTWVDISDQVTPPTYGYQQTDCSADPDVSNCLANAFGCLGQCSAQIGEFLYIVQPSYDDRKDTEWIYRLDLSQDPPVFSDPADFAYLVPQDNTTWYDQNDEAKLDIDTGYGSCVTTDGTYLYYMGGRDYLAWCNGFIRYDPVQDRAIKLAESNHSAARRYAGCAFTNSLDELYVFGGESDDAPDAGEIAVDWYSTNTNTWTNHGPTWNGRITDYNMAAAQISLRCFTNPFAPLIECIGGEINQFYPNDDVTIWDYSTDSLVTDPQIKMALAADEGSLVTIELEVEDGFGAILVLYIGGENSNSETQIVYPDVQYAIRYGRDTPPPTETPTETPTSPTSMPTTDPTDIPTETPSSSPTEETSAPTEGRSTTGTTEESPDDTQETGESPDGAIQINPIFTLLIVIGIALLK